MPGDLDFGSIIKLTPDIIEEIKRVEAQGGEARIKFDSNPNNASENNVIDVGGKEFKFTWAREPGDLCDIYEEQQSGEDGQGMLAECGSAWRKLNVERILDESTKNHVKMRSVEAERQSKSRKAIVLDHANPSVKNQVKSMAAAGVDGSNRRGNWTRKEPPQKKQRVEPSQGPPRLASKTGISSNTTTKGRRPVSPPSSPPRQPERGTSVSPFGTGKASNLEDDTDPFNIVKEVLGNLEKEMPNNVVHGATDEVNEQNCAIGDQELDLRNILINLLSKNPKGMTLKALEKAVGDTFPKSAKKIENIIKKIATFQAPGKYLLKPGVEGETSKTRVSDGSSPESAHNLTPVSESLFVRKAMSEKNEQQSQFESKVDESDFFENIDLKQNDPSSYTSDKNVNNGSDERACSSSGTGSDSDSDSDSSDSESDSRSRSKSRSISSSDSGSDGSSSSKEGSDVEVEIMSDEEGGHKNETAKLKLSSSPRVCTPSDEHEQIDIFGIDQEGGDASSPLELSDPGRGRDRVNGIEVSEDFHITNTTKDSESSRNEVAKSVELDAYQTNSRFSDTRMPLSPDLCKQTDGERTVRVTVNDTSKRGVYPSIDEKQTMMKDWSVNGQSEISDRKATYRSKRAHDSENNQEKTESAKKSKSASSIQALSSEKHTSIGLEKYSLDERGRSGSSNTACSMQPSPDIWNASGLVTEQLELGTNDPNGKKASGTVEKSGTCVETSDQCNKQAEGLSFRSSDNSQTDMPNESVDISEKCPVAIVRENAPVDRLPSSPDSYNRKYVEKRGTGKDNQELSHTQKFDTGKSSDASGKGVVLRRELSDLELGELREPSSGEETGTLNQQFDRTENFRSLDVTATDKLDLEDTGKGRTANAHFPPKKQSPANLRTGNGNQDGINRRVPVDNLTSSTRLQQRAIPYNNQQFSRVDRPDSEPMFRMDKPAEVARKNENRTQGMGLENNAGVQKNIHTGILPQDDKHASRTGIKNVKEYKPQRSREPVDRVNNNLLMENGNSGRKRKSLEEENIFYSKYYKDTPELKGPIKDFSQYEEYVLEYREKYSDYCSLNKSLEDTRDDYLQLGNELKDAKERDMGEYCGIQEELKQMYILNGANHKRLKKIFLLLHEELKTLKERIKDFAQAYSKD